MNAHCKECHKLIHFGGRGSRLKDLCHKGQCEVVYHTAIPFSHFFNRAGDKFDRVVNPEGTGHILVKRI